MGSQCPIHTTRQSLIDDLLEYGETALADQISAISPEQMDQIADRADAYVTDNPLIAKAIALAAVEVLEGEARPLARARRRFGQSPATPTDRSIVFRPWPERFWGTIMERVERLGQANRASRPERPRRWRPSVRTRRNSRRWRSARRRRTRQRWLHPRRATSLHVADQRSLPRNCEPGRDAMGDGLQIGLNVGARYIALEDLIARLSGRRFSPCPWVVPILMGNITPPEDRQPGGPLGPLSASGCAKPGQCFCSRSSYPSLRAPRAPVGGGASQPRRAPRGRPRRSVSTTVWPCPCYLLRGEQERALAALRSQSRNFPASPGYSLGK